MKPLYNIFKEGNVYQRNLQNYDESIVVSSGSFSGCVNCHSFLNNNPDNMVIQIRSKEYGVSMLHANNDGSVEKVDLKTRFGAPASYTAWHPSGRLIAFAFIKVRQFIHYSRVEVRDVLDLDSGLAIYDIESKTIKYNPNLSNHDILETFPTWSPDGKYLYFCTAPILWTDRESVPPENFKKVKYDLVRMSYNQESGEWGDVETVLSSDETGLSITQPRISPDGRFLLFCMSEYSCFVIHQPNSDLYLMDMTTGEYKRLDCNSDLHESWHSWSSNSRWIVFNSKRPDGLFAKPHLSYINKNGKAYKALILPQKDPSYYDSLVRTFNVPELIKEPIRIKRRAFVEAIKSFDKIQADKSVTTSATPQKPASQYLQP